MRSITTFAAIYIGSYEVSLKIIEISSKSQMREIDHIKSRIGIGRDIYKNQMVGTEIMDNLCATLSEYARIMKAYQVNAYKAYAGAFARDAKNIFFLIEQIYMQTGMEVQILSNSEKRFISYQSVAAKEEFDEMTKHGVAVVDIGGESVQITLFLEGNLVTTQHLVLGTMRLREQLTGIGNSIPHFEGLIEELVNKELEVFKAMYLKKSAIHYLVLMGDYSLELMRSVQKRTENFMSDTQEFTKHLKGFSKQSAESIAEELDLSNAADSLIIPSIVTYRCMAQELGAQQVWVPGNNIGDGIAYQYAKEHKLVKPIHDFEQDILSAATQLSKRYRSYSPHIEALTKMSTLIFDTVRKTHGMGNRERLLLQAAAILHDCGKFISLANAPECAYDVIMSSEIMGLSHLEREIVASTVFYNTNPLDPYEKVADKMDQKSYMTAAKLAAILRVSNALDRSHKQKFKTIRAVIKEKQLIITVETDGDIVLEKGILANKSDSFEAIFGIKPVLREKRSY